LGWELEFGENPRPVNSGRREAAGGERKRVGGLLFDFSFSIFDLERS
jgi:hypothetical protein